MKKIFTSLFAAVSVLLLGWSCSDDDDPAYLALSTREAVFGIEGGTKEIKVIASEAWAVEPTSEEWVSVSTTEEKLIVRAEKNLSADVRSVELQVTSGDLKETLKVSQEADGTAVTLEISAGDSYTFDSEGGVFTASVVSNAEWTASLEAETPWCEVTADPAKGIVKVVAPESNMTDAEWTATLTVTAGPEGKQVEKTIAFSQGTHAADPYFKFAGKWSLYSDDWRFGGASIGEGEYTGCTIVPETYKESFTINNLFFNGSTLSIGFDPENGSISIPTGLLVGQINTYYCYFATFDFTAGKFATASLTGTMSEDGKTVTLVRPEGYEGFGILGFNGSSYSMFTDMHYACGSTLELRKAEGTDASSAVAPAAATRAASQGKNLAKGTSGRFVTASVQAAN